MVTGVINLPHLHDILEGAAFGLIDGLICFSGLAIGVAKATSDPTLVIIAVIIGGIADVFSNSIGFYISQVTERATQIHKVREHMIKTQIHSKREVLTSGLSTFLASLFVLIVIVTPFVFFDITLSMVLVAILVVILSFVLGSYVGKLSGENFYRSGFKFTCLTLIGIFISYITGELLSVNP